MKRVKQCIDDCFKKEKHTDVEITPFGEVDYSDIKKRPAIQKAVWRLYNEGVLTMQLPYDVNENIEYAKPAFTESQSEILPTDCSLFDFSNATRDKSANRISYPGSTSSELCPPRYGGKSNKKSRKPKKNDKNNKTMKKKVNTKAK